MNTLKIKMNPFKDINIVSLDDKPLSPYSELNNYMKEPFLSWADKLLEAAEREINDDFSLVVVSGRFEQLFLKGLQKEFDACKEYITEPVKLDISTTERFELIKNLAQKYNLEFSIDEYKLPIYADIQTSLDSSLLREVTIEEAKLVITDNKELVKELKEKKEGFILVQVSECNNVQAVGNEQYVWQSTENEISLILESIVDRFVKCPIIVTVSDMLKAISTNMDDEDRKNLSLATEIDPFITVGDVSDIEVGESFQLVINVVPDTSEIPAVRIVPQNNSIIAIDGLNIVAVAPGTTYIDLYKADENIPFARKNIEVFQNNFVKKIDLSVDSSNMGIGVKQSIDIVYTPADAEDAGYAEWTVDNDDVISVNDIGEIVALKEGRATITATTKRATSSINVIVLPNIKSISTSIAESNLYVGQTETISVSIEPKNCYDSSYVWKTSDKAVAIVEELDDGTTVIRATGIGHCVLTCEAEEGTGRASVSVNVESTFKKNEGAHRVLSLTAVLAIACLFCAAFSATVAVLPLAIATVIFGMLAIIKNKADICWSIILMAFTVLLALETMGITNII